MNFSGYLLVSDMDATLLRSDHSVSEENRKAIEYFISNGGKFTVATGRMMRAVKAYFTQLKINAPAILHNGAQIYDFAKEKVIFEKFIEEERKPIIRRVYKDNPEFGIEVYSNDRIYVYRTCSETECFKGRGYDVKYGIPDEVWDEPWIKYLIIGEKEFLDSFEPIYRRDYDHGYAVRSGNKYLDIVSGGVSKGIALKRLAKKINANKVIAVGDNMNDISMLNAADIAFAVENAEDEVKKKADYVTPDNNSNAIAYIIKKLEELGE